jgi:hypothetical protein
MAKLTVGPILTLALSLAALGPVWALNPVSIKGTKFFDSVTQDQLFIKGVAYQPRTLAAGFSDPLSKPADCKRDFPLIKDLGLNTVRVYQVIILFPLIFFFCVPLLRGSLIENENSKAR